MQQLDIFSDGRDRVLVNTLAEAVARADLPQAQAAADALRAEFPADRHLAPAGVTMQALHDEASAGDTPWPDAAAARAAVGRVETVLAPAAVDLLGRDAAAPWLAARWRALARRARALPFDGEGAQVHAAALWLRGGGWAEAAQAVQGIERWRHRPLPLAWMAQAQWHLQGADSMWPLLAELAWLAPQRLPPLLAALPDARLHKLARRFESTLDGDPDWAWWPAWLLVDQPLLHPWLDTAQTDGLAPPPRGFKLLLALLRLERQGRHQEVVATRHQLQAVNPALFALYMGTR